jgi:3-deoxy-D-manno-octulosonic-acid transferase
VYCFALLQARREDAMVKNTASGSSRRLKLMMLVYQALLISGSVLLSPLWGVALLFVPKWRAGFWEKMGIWPEALKARFQHLNREAPVVWVHAVSVGEFLAIEPLVREMVRLQMQPVVSCTTRTGYTLAMKKLPEEVPLLYFPYDVAFSVHSALQHIRPDAVLLTETELWPYFIYRVSKRHAGSIQLINGRLSEKSFAGYKRFAKWWQPVLGGLAHAYMQTHADAERIRQLMLPQHAEHVSVMGNLKFDTLQLKSDFQQSETLRDICSVQPHQKIITVASTHESEEALILPMYYSLLRDFPELRLILAPRHPERVPGVMKLMREETLPFQLLSELKRHEHLRTPSGPRAPVILVDTIGDLKHLFPFSSMVVVAGSFLPSLGGHNILEPMMAGTPVLFGPYTSNFREIVSMVNAYGAGLEVATVSELKASLVRLLTMPEEAERLNTQARHLLQDHQGQRDTLLKQICQHLGWPYHPPA